MRLLILGLRRSGTTVFWESFRSDRRLVCYDEPFNPLLKELPLPEPKGTRDEFIALFRRDPKRFWQVFAPIHRTSELQEGMCDRQKAYLRYLLTSAPHVAMDVTRCHFKVGALHEVAPDAFVVHLLRPAAAWASSHLNAEAQSWRGRVRMLIKSSPHLGDEGQGSKGRVRTLIERMSFFERRDQFNNWGMEEIIGFTTESLFAQRLVEGGLDPETVYALPAAGRLLAFWKIHRDRVEADGRRIFGERFLTLPFPDFCRDPAGVLHRIYAFADFERPDLASLGKVHAARGAHRPGDPRWLRLAERVGLDPAVDLVF